MTAGIGIDKASELTPKDFDRLLNSYSQFSQPPLGSLLRGHVVKIAGSEVIVDVGYKCEGVISADEFKDIPCIEPAGARDGQRSRDQDV